MFRFSIQLFDTYRYSNSGYFLLPFYFCQRLRKHNQAFFWFALILFFISTSASYALEPPFSLPEKRELQKLRSALIRTNKGDLRFELFPDEAPWHVANFKYLADKGFYNNLSFFLFYPNYIIQAGRLPGNKSAAYSLPPEFSERQHEAGILGMARRPDDINPERRSTGSQFHILLGRAPKMDGSYTIFGELTEGVDVLEDLRKGDTIYEVKVFVRE